MSEKTHKETWEIAKKRFEKNTGQKKPSVTVLGFIKKHKTGVGSKFGKVDQAKTAVNTCKLAQLPAARKDYKKAYDEAEKEALTYMGDLATLINKEFGKDNKKGDKLAGDAYVKQLRILQNELDVILKEINADLKFRDLQEKEGAKGARSVKGYYIQIVPALSRAKQWTKRLATNPDPQFYNENVKDRIRGLTVQCRGLGATYKKAGQNDALKNLEKAYIPLKKWEGDVQPGQGANSSSDVTKQIKLIDASLNGMSKWATDVGKALKEMGQ